MICKKTTVLFWSLYIDNICTVLHIYSLFNFFLLFVLAFYVIVDFFSFQFLMVMHNIRHKFNFYLVSFCFNLWLLALYWKSFSFGLPSWPLLLRHMRHNYSVHAIPPSLPLSLSLSVSVSLSKNTKLEKAIWSSAFCAGGNHLYTTMCCMKDILG